MSLTLFALKVFVGSHSSNDLVDLIFPELQINRKSIERTPNPYINTDEFVLQSLYFSPLSVYVYGFSSIPLVSLTVCVNMVGQFSQSLCETGNEKESGKNYPWNHWIRREKNMYINSVVRCISYIECAPIIKIIANIIDWRHLKNIYSNEMQCPANGMPALAKNQREYDVKETRSKERWTLAHTQHMN